MSEPAPSVLLWLSSTRSGDTQNYLQFRHWLATHRNLIQHVRKVSFYLPTELELGVGFCPPLSHTSGVAWIRAEPCMRFIWQREEDLLYAPNKLTTH